MKITKKDLNTLIENYLICEVEEFAKGGYTFSFEMCDLTDIEPLAAYKTVKKFLNDKKGRELSARIRIVEDELNNLSTSSDPGADDTAVNKKLNELEALKIEMENIENKYFGAFSGIKSPTFIKLLKQLTGLGMTLTLGAASPLFCNTIRKIVELLDATAAAYTDAPERKDPPEVVEFDFFYNALESLASRIIQSNDLTSLQSSLWRQTLESLRLSDRELKLFKFIYAFHTNAFPKSYSLGRAGVTVDATATSEVIRRQKEEFDRAEVKLWIQSANRGKFKLPKTTGRGPAQISAKGKFNFVAGAGDREEMQTQLLSYANIRLIVVPRIGPPGTPQLDGTRIRNISARDYRSLSKTIIDKFTDPDIDFNQLTDNVKANLSAVPG